mmetsp:Transcript_12242/g.20079  ORF Transcript_12242/g.20079 Transcript_12242/m.20079 type:complete len:229 (+) Transcript_12242:45-731(+)
MAVEKHTDEAAPLPTTKKQKTMVEQAPDSEWPAAWLMPEGDCENQKAKNMREPNVPVTVEELKDIGICYWKLDASAYEYPAMSVPWDPKDAVDPKLAQIRNDRGYSYADIITVHPEKLPAYDDKVKAFFEEHIHDAEEIRYILGGSGFFDVRNKKDEWVRIHIKAGDLMTLPEGIYHRFTVDEEDCIHAMRLFVGQPVWTPFNRPCEEHESRKKYVEEFLLDEKKTEE